MIAILLFALAGVFKAVSDTLAHHFDTSIFCKKANDPGASWGKYLFWNPEISWTRKWKNGDKKQGEAFLFSSTALSFLTDAWHLFNMFQYLCSWLAVAAFYYQGPVFSVAWDMGILFAVFRIAFEVCYRWVFVKKK